jgi:UDP-3-O-[3-hydroxymyristoyl] glucosamine N-acyltransferase
MQLNPSHIRKIQQFSEKPIIGFIIFTLFSVYNLFGSLILQFHKFTRPTIIDPTAQIHPSASISPWGVYIGKNVIIDENAVIKPYTTIQSGATIHYGCVVGNSGYQIFRYKMNRLPIVHTGHVIISENVIIGNNSCIDRGLFGKITCIGAQSKIGEHVNIGHNTNIGYESIIQNRVTIGGNTLIGERVNIDNNSVISNRINISSGSKLTSGTVATHDISG